jgi:hypothetical protein
MRKAIIFAAAAGLAGFIGSSGAIAMTSIPPAGVRVATEAMDSTALVHCRPYRHWHEWEHRRTFGCGGGGSVEIRRGHRVGVGVEERDRTSVRSRTSISRGETSVRGSTSTKTGESTKSSTSTTGKTGTTSKSGTSTETKSGTSGGTSGRAQGGEKSSTGGSSGGASGGSSGGQKQQ